MDWNNPMAMFGLASEPQTHVEEVDDDENENNFYDGDDVTPQQGPGIQPGVATTTNHVDQRHQSLAPPTPTISAEAKAENQRKAELLRAKLLAQRQNTPSKIISRSGTPAKMNNPPINNTTKVESNGPSKDVAGLEALLAQGKAMADAQSAALAAERNKDATTQEKAMNGETKEPVREPPKPKETAVITRSGPVEPQAAPPEQKNPLPPSDSYYADLAAWLEITGYHDVEYRNSKLQNYKERRALEKQAEDIAAKLEKLRQAEEETIQSLRIGTPLRATNMAPPPLPHVLPADLPTLQANGTKRKSDDLFSVEKRRREDAGGFRIRGANGSPPGSRPVSRRGRTPSPPGIDRRPAHPDTRRRPSPPRSRDASLERRQSYYRRNGGPDEYDSYQPQGRELHRPPYNGANRGNSHSNRVPQYRGSAALDLRNGGQPSRPT